MKTYLLNLPKNKERLESMERQLKPMGIEYERFAVIGRDIRKQDWKKHFSSVRSYIANGRRLTVPELGCTMSHLEAYRRIVDSGEPYALILEDDIIFKPNFPDMLKKVESFMNPYRPQVVLFTGFGGSSKEEKETLNGIYPLKRAMCNDVYCVTRAAAQALIKYNYPILVVCDRYDRWVRRGQIELYRAFPISAAQDQQGFVSDLGQERFKKMPLIFVPFHKLKRLVGIVIDEILYWITGR